MSKEVVFVFCARHLFMPGFEVGEALRLGASYALTCRFWLLFCAGHSCSPLLETDFEAQNQDQVRDSHLCAPLSSEFRKRLHS